MKKKRNLLIILSIVVVLIIAGSYAIYEIFIDKDLFTVTEKKYIIDNKSKVISINVLNDANVFGLSGEGIFYDFLKSFQQDNDLSFDIVTTSVNAESSGLSLTKSNILAPNSKLIYTDHYVLVGKSRVNIANIGEIQSTIGYLTKDQSSVLPVLNNYSLTLKNYDEKAVMLDEFQKDEISYIVVPMIEYLDIILSNLYVINYHLSDVKDYYFLQNGEDTTLASIMSKYYNKWKIDNQNDSFNKNEYKLFIDKLKITQKELDVINNKKYKYAFVNNGPYDVSSGGSYGGTISKYIKGFSEFSGISFDFDVYGNLNKLIKAVNKGNVDLFTNYYSLETPMATIESLFRMDISFVMSNSDNRVINSINGIKDEDVYVRENSVEYSYLSGLGLNIKTYKDENEIKKILNNNSIVAMGYSYYLIYKEQNTSINERFRIDSNRNLNFQSNNDTMFNRLFSYYVSTIDKNEILYTGVDDYNRTVMSGSLIYKVTKYAIILILAIGILVYFSYRIGKKAFVRKKIKRNDKMKYIDILTSLKNRNYLNESIPIWNQNTIYPQAVIVIDLNSIQELNETLGYIEGDRQIQGAANSLIKTQLDNSEIMRTDGNEFTVYLVGYSEKQVISYIKKLNKEFKNLPHDRGAAIGFSMIEDDLKLINDAVNEATERMKENKALLLGEKNGEKI